MPEAKNVRTVLLFFILPWLSPCGDGGSGTGADDDGLANALVWAMFHHDERHTGVADGAGSFAASGPMVRWSYQVIPEPAEDEFNTLRWYSSFPLGDLDGDGTLEVVVTSPDKNSGEYPPQILALKDDPDSEEGVTLLWEYDVPSADESYGGVDQYSAALADADGDGLVDVFFSTKNGFVRALQGTTGEVIWAYDTGHFIEAGPMIADLDGDGANEVIVVTDCNLDLEDCPGISTDGSLYVFAANPEEQGTEDPLLWSQDFAFKLDSMEPAVADLDDNDGQSIKALIIGSWGGVLYVVWRDSDGNVIMESLALSELDAGPFVATPVVRSSPMVVDYGDGWVTVFGWMPDPGNGDVARISAVGLEADMLAGTVDFTALWTVDRDAWKSSVALLPRDDNDPLFVAGYGIGTDSGTGNYGHCSPLNGGIVAVNTEGEIAWEIDYDGQEGNVRGSPAVADIDGDGEYEVLLTMGCYGKLHAYNGTTGEEEWNFDLGPRTIASPSIGDIDGDGALEIVIASYDGKVYVLDSE